MAAPKAAPQAKFPEDTDDIDDLPEPLSEAETNSIGLSSEAIAELPMPDDELDSDAAKINPPQGDWEKDDRWELEEFTFKDDCQPHDKNPEGRTIYTIRGKPKPRSANGLEYQPTLRVRVSPDKRFSESDPQKFDLSYRLWVKAREVYIAINEQKPTKIGQLCAFLAEESYIVRTSNMDNGPLVLDLKVKRERNIRR